MHEHVPSSFALQCRNVSSDLLFPLFLLRNILKPLLALLLQDLLRLRLRLGWRESVDIRGREDGRCTLASGIGR